MELTREQLIEGFEYLDDLRDSGRTNMFGSQAYVQDELGWEKVEAKALVTQWMGSFDPEISVEDRVDGICNG